MSKETALELTLLFLFLAATTVIIALTSADIRLSSSFSFNGTWPLTNLFPWRQLYLLDRTPAILLAVSALLIAGCSYFRTSLKAWRKYSVFILLALIIGPGLIVNAGFKDNWGRPRPREIVQFGGKKEFRQPWQKSERKNGRSFPSGHGSAAFFMLTPYFIYRKRNHKKALCWLAGGISFGLIMSAARIVQGAHFLSDNLWAFGFVYMTGLLLAEYMKIDPD